MFDWMPAGLGGMVARRFFGGGPLAADGEKPRFRAAQMNNWLRTLFGNEARKDKDGRDEGGRWITILFVWLYGALAVGITGERLGEHHWPVAVLVGFILSAIFWWTGHGAYIDPEYRKGPDNEKLAPVVSYICRTLGVHPYSVWYGVVGMSVVYGVSTVMAGLLFNLINAVTWALDPEAASTIKGLAFMPVGLVAGPVLYVSTRFFRSRNLKPWIDWKHENGWFELGLGFVVHAAAAAVT